MTSRVFDFRDKVQSGFLSEVGGNEMNRLQSVYRIIALLGLVLVFLVEANAFAASGDGAVAKKVPSCAHKGSVFDDLKNRQPEVQIPSSVLVGRTVNLMIESESGDLKVWVKHNFKTGQKEFVCATIPKELQQNFSVPILVLNDRTDGKRVGDSVWQFQVMVRDHEIGLWNQKSGLLRSEEIFAPTASPIWFAELGGERLLLNKRKYGPYHIQSLVEFDPVRY